MIKTNATETRALVERINQNLLNQSVDMNKWAFNLIGNSFEKLEILELCCGTGKQTEQLLKSYKNSNLTCVDISNESLRVIEKSAFFEKGRVKLINDNMDSYLENNENLYDIIFVSYGLYYANNIEKVLNNILSSLRPQGHFFVLGPYGENNKQLFSLVNSIGVSIDRFVKYSSSDFMYDAVIRKTLGKFESIVINTVVNNVRWNSSSEVVNYWENSTFYEPLKKRIFINRIENHFKSNDYFENSKHIMLLRCLNKAEF